LKRDCILLIIIVGLAFFLRFWDLGWNGFNGDESIYSGQAASLLGNTDFLGDFSVFRSHPLLLQSLVSIAFAIFGIQDVVARIIPVIFGTLSVFMTYHVGKLFFDRNVGLISCLVLALLPFHIVFSRQVLLDVPFSFFIIMFLYLGFKYRITKSNISCFSTGVACGLCFLSKEVGIITVPIFVGFMLITRIFKVNKLFMFLIAFTFSTLPYVILALLRKDAATSVILYTAFQISRNQDLFSTRYATTLVNEALGYALSLLLVISVFLMWWQSRKSRGRQSMKYKDQIILLVLTLGILFLLFQFLPSKGDRFMITLVPPAVILGCSFLAFDSVRRWRGNKMLYMIIVPLIILSNNFFLSKAFPIMELDISDNLGTPWHREASLWIKHNTPANSGILTSETRVANIIRFYTNYEVFTVEINRNPSYLQINNPAFLILNKNVSIIVEDLRPGPFRNFLNEQLRNYLEMFDSKLVHVEYKYSVEDGKSKKEPMIRIYQFN
jgi:4-amino-4-deoxy-L-arabinose transferase-like glycosyltransferase